MSQDKVPAFPPTWNVPYRRNPYFTGREDVLKQLRDGLTVGKTTALTQPQAISGLGGIGKTQTAIEYAYRYSGEYQAVLWVKADSRDVLISDFVSIAGLLDLPLKNEQDQNIVVNAVKHWLQSHNDWLLILDNVEDWDVVPNFIPTGSRGHILLTTRAQATGTIAQSIEIVKMTMDEGVLFFLRRAKLIEKASKEDHSKAKEISEIMDGLPLALDEAGAYIEETRCGLSHYFDLFQERRAKLLRRRGSFASGHPESVTTTFSLSFEKIEQANLAAVELLRLCAFLHPDDIPEEIITEGAADLGPVLQAVATDLLALEDTIGELLKYSVVRRDRDNKTLSIHRLVQAVLKDDMDEGMQRLWAERSVKAVNHVFPDIESAPWQQCQKYLPNAQTCSTLIKQWEMKFMEAARLLDLTGRYMKGRALHVQAEPFFLQALTICKQVLGPNHPEVATYLNNLAELYRSQGKYKQASPLYQEALALWQQTLGPEHSNVATCLNNLALLNYANGMYEQAELLFLQAIAIWEKTENAEDLAAANSFNSLADVYRAQGKYSQAEQLFLRALAIREQTRGPEHTAVATCLHNLALLYSDEGKYPQAEQLFLRAINIYEHTEVPDHPDVATYLNNLAQMYRVQVRYSEAEPLFQRALSIREQAFGPEHPQVATSLLNYARLLRMMDRESEATQLEARAITKRVKHAQENTDQ